MEQTPAASSTAETDVFNGQEVSMAEFSKFRTDGTLPERFKPAEPAAPAPADTPEQTDAEGDEPENASDAATDDAQEQPQLGRKAQRRFEKLLAENKELKRQQASRQDATPASSPAATPQHAPQNYQEYRAAFKPSQFVEDYGKAHPDASYEDANAAMADHLLDVRDHFKGIETRVNAEKQALESKVGEARDKYADFDEIKDAFLAKVISDKGTPLIPLQVLGIINDSEVMAHLLYTIGSDEAELAKFVEMAKSNPNKAIRYVTRVESLIAEELAKPKGETQKRGEDGKFAPERQRTSAPKPPEPVGGGSSRAYDVSDESLPPDEWMRKRNQQLGKV